ncbi:hypothetical protein BGZ49_010141 [Haplosporangium sp. Z 27]|nr:hypothetical protein BGZ49_010141 [Haplosporangium sp. Z 27]
MPSNWLFSYREFDQVRQQFHDVSIIEPLCIQEVGHQDMRLNIGDAFSFIKVLYDSDEIRLIWYRHISPTLTPISRPMPKFAMNALGEDVDVITLMMDTQSDEPQRLKLGYVSIFMKISECVRVWYTSLGQSVEFECSISPWLESLELAVTYENIAHRNSAKNHKEWVSFYKYSNEDTTTYWSFELFINIDKASPYRGTVMVFEAGRARSRGPYRKMYVYQDLKRRLEFENYSEAPNLAELFGTNETINMTYNYHIVKNSTRIKYDTKSNAQLNDENLHELIGRAEEAIACGRTMYSFQFQEPALVGMVAELLLFPLISSNRQEPSLMDEPPESEDELPESEDELPEPEDELPEPEDELPESEDELPESGDDSPAMESEPSTIDHGSPAKEDEPPVIETTSSLHRNKRVKV